MADTNPTDIFGTSYGWGGSWKLDGPVVKIKGTNGKDNLDLIVNSCQIQYARPVNKIIPLNTPNQFIIAGRGAGTLTLGMVVGPSNAISQFIKDYKDPCNIKNNNITITATGNYCTSEGTGDKTTSKTKGNTLNFVCKYCLLQSINSAVQAGDVAIVSAGMTLIIGILDLEDGNA